MWVAVGSRLCSVAPAEVTQKGQRAKRKTTTKPTLTAERYQGPTVATVDYFERKLDDKRRLTIPAELRAEFAGGVIVTRGFGDYLHLYPKIVWDNDVEPALNGSILDERIADLNVKFREGKTEAVLDDKQGRITLEQHLLDFAGITRDVTAVRAGKYWRLKKA